jgi:hypothetical protein
VLTLMKHMKLSFEDFVIKTIENSSRKRQLLMNKKKWTCSFVKNNTKSREYLEHCRLKYQKELRVVNKLNCFETWNVKNIKKKSSFSTTMTFIKKVISQLLRFFRFIIISLRDENESNNTHANDSIHEQRKATRWIIIFFILCYIHKLIKCNLWIVNWNLQLHANETKRRVIQTLNHVELFVKYQRVLKQFKSLRTNQEKDMKNLNQTRQFFVTWDNFEQIERVKNQRLNNKIKFLFVITTQIFSSIWMLENELKQNMLNQLIELNYRSILSHKAFKRDSKMFKKICLTK